MNLWKTHRTQKQKRILIPRMHVPWNLGCIALVLTGIKLMCANGSIVHITQFVNEYFNGNVELASTDRVRRTANTAGLGHTPTNPDNVALRNTGNVDEEAVTILAIFFCPNDLHMGLASDMFCGHI